MESNVQPSESQVDQAVKSQGFNADTTPSGAIIGTSSSASPGAQWQEWVDPVKEFLSQLPEQLGSLYADNQKLISTVALIAAAFIAVKFTLAILDAINDIPLMAPLLELVGLGYTIWFVYRYLLQASSRRELVGEFDTLKTQVLGNNSQDS